MAADPSGETPAERFVVEFQTDPGEEDAEDEDGGCGRPCPAERNALRTAPQPCVEEVHEEVDTAR